MDLKHRICEMLGQGLPTGVVASALGCDPSYISQLMEDQEFKDKVLIARATKAEGNVARDTKWDEIEDAALNKAKDLIPLVSRPGDLIRIAAMANSAKRRSTELANGSETAAPTVVLNLPQAAVVHFQMNSSAQVIAIDGRSMQAMPTNKLAELVKDKREEGEVTDVEIPTAVRVERKKVMSTLEAIGFSDSPPPVVNVLQQQTAEKVPA